MDGENAQCQFPPHITWKSANLYNEGYNFITIPPTHEHPGAGERNSGVINRQRRRHSAPRKSRPTAKNSKTALVALLAAIPVAMAETCVSLSGSTVCPAFDAASISTDSTLTGLFPFLQYVSDRETFDTELQSYVSTTYVQTKYETLLGCSNVDLTNTTDYYARYTTTVICNSIVQNSISPCGLSTSGAQPVCADTCAQYAESEDLIINESSLCGNSSSDALTQIRADFTNCALPASSLGGSCITGSDNEPDNCGYGNSTLGLCTYCASGGENSTDTCCYNSGASTRCENVVLPSIVASMTFAISSSATPSATASSTGSASATHRKGLSGGAIAGIVIGSVAGLVLLAALIFLLLLCLRRRRENQAGANVLNQPSPARTPNPMSYNPISNKASTPANGYEVLPGGRIARMSALEGHSGHSGSRGNSATYSVPMTAGAAALSGAAAGYGAGSGRHRRNSYASSDEYSQPSTLKGGGILHPPPNRRTGSLSSGSAFGGFDDTSPRSRAGSDELSSPLGANSQKSEELSCFKDYYSQDDIHIGDKVATLWAYTPRAGDEHKLERGDMLRIVGIWDDGWATGVMLQQRADDWENRKILRDSGVSSGANQGDSSPVVSDEVKAFPLVCVCLPDHWRRTIEGDGSTESGDNQRDLPIMGQS